MGTFLDTIKSRGLPGPRFPNMASANLPIARPTRRFHNPHVAGKQMPGYEEMEVHAPPVEETVMAAAEENAMAYPGTDPRLRVARNFNVPAPGTQGLDVRLSGGSNVPVGGSSMPDSATGGVPSVDEFMSGLTGQGLSTDEILARARVAGVSLDAVLSELTKPQYRPTPPPDTSVGRFRMMEAMNPPRPQPGLDITAAPPPMSPLARPPVSYVAGRHIVNEGPAEGTFPDMVMPAPRVVPMGQPPLTPADYANTYDAEAAYFQQGPFAIQPSPPAAAMQTMLRDAASRPTNLRAAPVDISRSDTMLLDRPVARPRLRTRSGSRMMY